MRSSKEIDEKLAQIEADDRLHTKDALVQVNAPLALEQVNLKAWCEAIRWVLSDGETK